MSAVLSPVAVEYPSTDGKPVAESDFQRDYLLYVVDALQEHFRARRDVYVTGNLLLYYEEGNRRAMVAPDVFVVMGAANHRRSSYLLWQEPKGPDFVMEVTSKSTRQEDQGAKRELYRRLGVREYWQYDPTGDYLAPALQGYELRGGEYERLPGRELAAGVVALGSAVLGLELRLDGGDLRLYDPVAGRALGTREEIEADLRERDAELRERDAELRERNAEMRERNADLKETAAELRAAEARLREEVAARQRETAARAAAEARAAELEALLRKMT